MSKIVNIPVVNLITTSLVICTTTSLVYGISWFLLNRVTVVMQDNAKDVISSYNEANSEQRILLINKSILSLENIGGYNMNLARAGVTTLLKRLFFEDIESKNLQTHRYVITTIRDYNTDFAENYTHFIYSNAQVEPITFTLTMFNSSSSGWGVVRYPMQGLRCSADWTEFCQSISPTGLISGCCGDPCRVPNYVMDLGDFHQNVIAVFGTGQLGQKGYWSRLSTVTGFLTAGFVTPLYEFNRFVGYILRQIRMDLLSGSLEMIAETALPGLLVFTTEKGDLLTCTSNGENVQRIREVETDYDSTYTIRVLATNSSNPIIRSVSRELVKIYGSISNITKINMTLFQLDIGNYYITVDLIAHYNLRWNIICVLPVETLMAKVYKSRETMEKVMNDLNLQADQSVRDSDDKINKKLRTATTNVAIVISLSIVLSILIAAALNVVIGQQIDKMSGIIFESSNLLFRKKKIFEKSHFLELHKMLGAHSKLAVALKSFQLYVPQQIVLQILEQKEEAKLGLKHCDATVLFMSLDQFTNLIDNVELRHVQAVLGDYMEYMSLAILESGTIDKYIGDSIMAFWNALVPLANHHQEACRIVLKCQTILQELHKKWTQYGWPLLNFRAGLNCGDVLVGNLGSSRRLNYTVLGDTVNCASRLEVLNKSIHTRILISNEIADRGLNGVVMRNLGRAKLIGRQKIIGLKELMCDWKDDVEIVDRCRMKADSYHAALNLAKLGKYKDALTHIDIGDKTSGLLGDRILAVQSNKLTIDDIDLIIQLIK
eukprot:NODE_354_length_2892_cov_38.317443_g300_i0.p1 GENE.NODE_354_length_2892_cov_38.317443_g300_i0~~NODE_354_length_2892_cov_38.317443_g300_i0.p1  ORF type:complete len:774 (-),score=105.00 NODE_354_length_2892_cov_38.317443_g300_i0:510-2831(-)